MIGQKTAIEFESARVAAGFGVEKLVLSREWHDTKILGCSWPLFEVTFRPLSTLTAIRTRGIEIFRPYDLAPFWQIRFCGVVTQGFLMPEMLARGLYRLGFEDESIFSQLPELTWTEKMELRLSLSREFWPDSWKEVEQSAPLLP